jgi:hypothetical protein
MDDLSKQSNSYRKVRTEINRLKRLYATSIFSFGESSTAIADKIKRKEINPNEPIPSTIDNLETDILASNAFALMNQMKKQFSRYLRETIFVRLVSVLEVFLMDVIRDVFLSKRDLFHSDTIIRYSYRELLSLKSIADIYNRLISRETRTLQNQGFEKVAKYYESRFGIVLAGENTTQIFFEELHDRRHLLVHRLGETDSAYRHKYNSKERKVTIDEDYLYEAFIAIDNLAKKVAGQSLILINNEYSEEFKVMECEATIKAEIVSKACTELFKPKYVYSCQTGIVLLKDIIISIEEAGNLVSMKVGGTKEQIQGYIKILRNLSKSGAINLIDARRKKSPKCQLPYSELVNIAKTLPPAPWDKDCHKMIAKKFGISNKQAYAALAKIRAEKKYNNLIGGEI